MDRVFSRGIGRHSIALSRDGAQLVYSGVPAGLYLRAMSQLEVTRIQGTEGFARVTEPVFSPDGQSIAFYTDGALKRIAVTGGAAVTIVRPTAPYGISWGEDGIVFGQGGTGILRVSPDGGTPETLVRVEDGEEAHGPQILPAANTCCSRWRLAPPATDGIEGASSCSRLPREFGRPFSTVEAMRVISRRVISSTR
jgi:Periplasmic component of the Tol biopolymer transport system